VKDAVSAAASPDDRATNPGAGGAIRLARCVLLLPLLQAAPAIANDYCVHDAAELTAALADVSTSGGADGQDNLIRVAAGTYATNLEPFRFKSASNHSFALEGGYDGTCAHLDPTPGMSVLDGGKATQVLNVETANAVVIRHLTIRNGSLAGSAGAGAQVYLSQPGASLVFENNQVVENASAWATAGLTVFGDAADATTADISGNLFSGNLAPSSAALSTALGAGSVIRLTNNTIAGNSNTSGGNMITALGGGSAGGLVANNISYANTNGYDFYLYSFETFEFDANVFHQVTGAAKPGGTGNVDANPKFADATSGDFHLLSGSPAFARGAAAATPDVDLEGRVYPASGKVDLGAYEETQFSDHFDGG